MSTRISLASRLFYPLVLVASLALVGAGISLLLRAEPTLGAALIAVGAASTMGALLLWPIVALLREHGRRSAQQQEELLAALAERLQQVSVMLNEIGENQLISDRAKSVAYREKDREALRRAIREEMSRKDWEAARALADEMEEQFGYRQEAAALRREIDEQLQEVIRRRIAESVAVIERHCRGEQWEQAFIEANRLAVEIPGHEQVLNLPREIEGHRQAFKKQLMDNWNAAVARHEVDGSIEILRQLDPYLTREEASAMEETARSVFKEKLLKLRDQFAEAVQERRFGDAFRIGDVIVKEFPNARIAQEIRERMDGLREKAEAV